MPRGPLTQHATSASLDLEDGRRLDLFDVIGVGACSSVYRAVVEAPHGLRRVVAAKILGMIASDDAEHVVSTLALAAQRNALARHPNVVATYDFVVSAAQPVLLMELVDGVSLATLARRYAEEKRRLPLELALFIATEVAEGLAGARIAEDEDGVQLGLLHLGLTPHEVLLSWTGEVKVEGFGLDTLRGGTSSVRSLRAVAGRANMMSPEIAAGEPGDARSDVFSLGVILRELLVGPRFPRGIGNAEAIRLAREGYVQPICFQPHLPEDVVHIIERAIEIDPEARYPNATAMVFDLRRAALTLGVGDARFFLRRTLDRELGDGTNDGTAELTSTSTSTG